MVQEILPHRTINMIKNRFYGHIKNKYFPKNTHEVLFPMSLLDYENNHTNLYTNTKLNMLIEITEEQSKQSFPFNADP